MFKVMCVSLEDFTNGKSAYAYIGLVMDIGDEFHVVAECIGYCTDGTEVPCYDLFEFGHTPYVFDQRNFATLPDQDADEMKEETKEAVVPCPAY